VVDPARSLLQLGEFSGGIRLLDAPAGGNDLGSAAGVTMRADIPRRRSGSPATSASTSGTVPSPSTAANRFRIF